MEEQFWSLCVAKGITVISRAKSSEQNNDKTNNSDDVILCQDTEKDRRLWNWSQETIGGLEL